MIVLHFRFVSSLAHSLMSNSKFIYEENLNFFFLVASNWLAEFKIIRRILLYVCSVPHVISENVMKWICAWYSSLMVLCIVLLWISFAAILIEMRMYFYLGIMIYGILWIQFYLLINQHSAQMSIAAARMNCR